MGVGKAGHSAAMEFVQHLPRPLTRSGPLGAQRAQEPVPRVRAAPSPLVCAPAAEALSLDGRDRPAGTGAALPDPPSRRQRQHWLSPRGSSRVPVTRPCHARRTTEHPCPWSVTVLFLKTCGDLGEEQDPDNRCFPAPRTGVSRSTTKWPSRQRTWNRCEPLAHQPGR